MAKKSGGRKVRVVAKNPVKRRSAAAAALAGPRYRKRVVNSAKVYRRKGKTPAGREADEQS